MPKGAFVDVRDLQMRNRLIYVIMGTFTPIRFYTLIKMARLLPN